MGLDNFWLKATKWDEDTNEAIEFDKFCYGGQELPCDFLNGGLVNSGYFRGKVFTDLFDALLEDINMSLFCGDDDMSRHDIEYCAESMQWAKNHLLEEDGELWLESFKNEHLKDSHFVSLYTYETVMSFIMMFEWYARQDDVFLHAWF